MLITDGRQFPPMAGHAQVGASTHSIVPFLLRHAGFWRRTDNFFGPNLGVSLLRLKQAPAETAITTKTQPKKLTTALTAAHPFLPCVFVRFIPYLPQRHVDPYKRVSLARLNVVTMPR